jgi:uncharacterized protein YraI
MASSHLRLGVGALLFSLSFAAAAENAITTDSASVRAGPDSSYPEVAQLDADTPIQVMGCLDDWSWCDVAFDGSRGWLYSPDITYQYQGGYVPFYTYAPGLGVPVESFTVDAYWGSYYHDRPWYRERDQWVHRTVQHQRPSGPAPRSGPPPREAVRMDRPHGGPPADRSIRLGNADPAHRDTERHDGAAGHVDGRPDDHRGGTRAPRPQDQPRPQEQHVMPSAQHPEPPHAEQHPEGNARPPERAMPQERATPQQHATPEQHAAPEHNEAHAGAAAHPEPQHPEPQHREEPHPQGEK